MSALETLGADVAARGAFSLLAVRATILLLLGAAAMPLLRRGSAAARHAALAFTVMALLCLPALSDLLPRWEMALLPPGATPASLSTSFAAPTGGEATRSPWPSLAQPADALKDVQRDVPRDVPNDSPRDGVTGAKEDAPAGVASAPIAGRPPSPRGEQSAPGLATLARWPLSRWLLLAWAAGISVGLTQLVFATALVRRAARAACPMSEPDWLGHVAGASAHLGLRRVVRLLSSTAVAVPVVYGYRHATVLLPPDADEWTQDRRRAFLLHELAHVARHDCLTQTLGHLARLLYWPNPLAWWLVRRLRAEAERACDDRVLSAGTPASDYAAYLLDAARELKRAQRPLAVLAVVERSRLEDRLLALLDPGLCRGVLTARSLVLGAVLSLILAGSVAALQPVARPVAREAAAARLPISEEPAVRAVPSPSLAPPSRAEQSLEAPVGPAARAADLGVPGTRHRPLPTAMEEEEHAPTSVERPEAAPSDVAVGSTQNPVTREPGGVEAGSLPPAPPASPTPLPPNVPVIRISTELVQIDAVVTDKAGRPIVDLRPEDFEVFENGRRQTISHLVYVKTGLGPTTGGAAEVAAAPQTTAPRTMLFVVDDLGLSLHSMDRTRRLLSAFAEGGLGATDRAAIVATSEVGTRALSLSLDPSALLAAAGRLRYSLWSRTAFPAGEIARGDEVAWESFRAIDSLAALKATIDALRVVPGRKAVIFLSEGFRTLTSHDSDRLIRQHTFRPLDALYDQDTDLRAALRSLTDLANRASVVIYTIDPAGLTTDSLGADSAGESGSFSAQAAAESRGETSSGGRSHGDGSRARSLNRAGRQESLIELAEQTGGLAVWNRNDLGGGLDQILADHAGYYLVGYEPESTTFASRPGHVPFHKVRVEVKRRGLKVRSRKGFYGVPDEVIAKAAPPSTN